MRTLRRTCGHNINLSVLYTYRSFFPYYYHTIQCSNCIGEDVCKHQNFIHLYTWYNRVLSVVVTEFLMCVADARVHMWNTKSGRQDGLRAAMPVEV